MKQAGENSNSLKMVFRNRPENEKIVRTTAAVFASVLDPTLEEISDFKTAVSEAVTNAIIHAYPKTGGDIEAYFKREDKKITVLITDYGIGIKDVGKSMQPLYSTLHTQERSGMGFTFMEVSHVVRATAGRIIFNRNIPQDLGFVKRFNEDGTPSDKFFDYEITETCGKKLLGKIVDKTIKQYGFTIAAEVLDNIKRRPRRSPSAIMMPAKEYCY